LPVRRVEPERLAMDTTTAASTSNVQGRFMTISDPNLTAVRTRRTKVRQPSLDLAAAA
jgi:hypothetical protein